MEKDLGISYPTVRNKLEEIIKILEAPAWPAAVPASGREAILRQVASGALSAEEALSRLRSVSTEEK
jgi:hypothetical protein